MVEWNGGMERWNGMVEWTTGMECHAYRSALRPVHKVTQDLAFTTKQVSDDQTQERNAGERKDRIQVYPSVVLRFYKRRRNATHCLASYCHGNQPLYATLLAYNIIVILHVSYS